MIETITIFTKGEDRGEERELASPLLGNEILAWIGIHTDSKQFKEVKTLIWVLSTPYPICHLAS